MTNKVLVADDCDCISLSINQILEKRAIFDTNSTKGCDATYMKIKKAIYDKVPYDLLICDLNFRTENKNCIINSGEELIAAIRKIQPKINIIVFSEEVKSFRIRSLFKDYNINAFVHKGGNSIFELENSIQNIFLEGVEKSSLEFEALRSKPLIEVEEYDISLLKLISIGYTLKEISIDFKKLGIVPSSESSIEKGINKIKIQFNAINKAHLIAITKDLGLI